MQSIKLCSHVGADGILHLEIPIGITDKERDVVGIYQQIEPSAPSKTPQELGWSPGFLNRLTSVVKMLQLLLTMKVILRQGKK